RIADRKRNTLRDLHGNDLGAQPVALPDRAGRHGGSRGGHAGVDGEDAAGDAAGGVAAQPGDEGGDLVGLDQAAEGVVDGEHRRAVEVVEGGAGLQHGAGGGAWGNGVGGDAVLAEFGGQASDEPDDA